MARPIKPVVELYHSFNDWRLLTNDLSENVGDPATIYSSDTDITSQGNAVDSYSHPVYGNTVHALNDLNSRKVKRSGDTITGSLKIGANFQTVGNSTLNGTLQVDGNTIVGANKLIVTAASGNTSVAGTLSAAGDFSVNTTKLTVNATSGNTIVGGTLEVQGSQSKIATKLIASTTSFDFLDATTTGTVNFGNNAATLSMGAAATSFTLGSATASSTTNISNGVLTAGTKTLNIGTEATGGTTVINIGASNAAAVNTVVIGNANAGSTVQFYTNTIQAYAGVTTFNLLNTNATTVNAFGAAATLNVGPLTAAGTSNIVSGNLATGTRTLNLGTGTISGGAVSNVNIGGNLGTTTFNSPTVASSQATLTLWNTTTTAMTFGGAVTTFSGLDSTTTSTFGIGNGATVNAATKTINVGQNGVSGSTTAINLGTSVAGISNVTVGSNTASSSTTIQSPTFKATGAALSLGGGATVTASSDTLSTTTAVNLYTGLTSASVKNINIGTSATNARSIVNLPSTTLVDSTFNTPFLLDLSHTWNDAGTTFESIHLNVTNTAANAASELLSLNVASVHKFVVGVSGDMKAYGASRINNSFYVGPDDNTNNFSVDTNGNTTNNGTFTVSGVSTLRNRVLVSRDASLPTFNSISAIQLFETWANGAQKNGIELNIVDQGAIPESSNMMKMAIGNFQYNVNTKAAIIQILDTPNLARDVKGYAGSRHIREYQDLTDEQGSDDALEWGYTWNAYWDTSSSSWKKDRNNSGDHAMMMRTNKRYRQEWWQSPYSGGSTGAGQPAAQFVRKVNFDLVNNSFSFSQGDTIVAGVESNHANRTIITPVDITTKTVNATSKLVVGSISYFDAVETTISASGLIWEIPAATYRSGSFEVQINSGSKYQRTSISFVHNGSSVTSVEYGGVNIGGACATFALTYNVINSTVEVAATLPAAVSTTFKIHARLMS